MADSIRDIAADRNRKQYDGPKEKLFKFSGRAIDYWPFIRQFEDLVEARTDDLSIRLSALLEHTTGEVHDLLVCCRSKSPGVGYRMAREMMAETFGGEEDGAQAWVSEIRNLPKVFDLDSLRQYCNKLRVCKETLESMKLLPRFETKPHLKIVIDKLTKELRLRWQQANGDLREKKQQPTLRDVIHFLTRIIQEKADPYFGSELDPDSPQKVAPAAKGSKMKEIFCNVVKCDLNDRDDVNVDKIQSCVKPTPSVSDYMSSACNVSNVNRQAIDCSGHCLCKQTALSCQQTVACNCRSGCANEGASNMMAYERSRGFIQSQPDGSSYDRPPVCPLCNADHSLYRCEQFRELDVPGRLAVVRDKKLCVNCIRPRHFARKCRSPFTCRVCERRPHSMLHSNEGHVDRFVTPQNNVNNVIATTFFESKIALPVVPVVVQGDKDSILTYALLDSGSSCTLCTERLAKRVGVETKPYSTYITTIDRVKSRVECSLTSLNITSCENSQSYSLESVMIRPALNISTMCRALSYEIVNWPHLEKLEIQKVELDSVDLLIGQNNPYFLVPLETRTGESPKDPYAIKTILGWYVSGPISDGKDKQAISCHAFNEEITLSEQVERFWEVDNVPRNPDDEALSVSDRKVLEMWKRGLSRQEDQYVLPIPFKNNPVDLPNNLPSALSRLHKLTYKLRKDENLRTQYVASMRENIDKGFAVRLTEEELSRDDGKVWYLPHHAVAHPRKPGKVRLVFDCSAKFRGVCLNDVIHSGPDLMNKFLPVLLRFRQDAVAFTGDVEGMCNQVLVNPDDRDVLRMVWFKNDEIGVEVEYYKMRTHIFGGIWSPSCANFALKRTADDHGDEVVKEVVETVRRQFYVDDCPKSVSDIEDGIKMVGGLKQLLSRGGFNLTKFASHSLSIVKSVEIKDRAKTLAKLDIDGDHLPVESVLGSGWCLQEDKLVFLFTVPDNPDTRRGVLGSTTALFDPMGHVAPVIIQAKFVVQDTCRRQYQWDQHLEADLKVKWEQWIKDIGTIGDLQFDRCLLPAGYNLKMPDLSFQLHFYSDTSERAYGSAVYFRVLADGVPVSSKLILAKGKVAPIKQMSIPRLEFAGAYVSVQLLLVLLTSLEVKISECVFWTDSTVVLHYLNNDTKRFKTFVANRVGFIHSHTTVEQWRHVPTRLNPADILSRGCMVSELTGNMLWSMGPFYLLQAESLWPPKLVNLEVEEETLEVKREQVVAAQYTVDEDSPSERVIGYQMLWYKLKKFVSVFEK